MKSENDNFKTHQRLASSAFGALVTSILVTPLDVVKIRMQAQYKPMSSGDCFIYCNGLMDHLCQCLNGNGKMASSSIPWYKKPGHFNNSLDVLQNIVKSEGVTSLWSGLSPALVMAIPQVVIYYTLNDWLKLITGYSHFQKEANMYINKDHNKFTRYDMIPPMCAAVARLVSQTTIAPLELIRTKMQSKKLSYTDMKNITQTAIKQGGVSVLWRGMGPTMWRDVPYTVTLWFIYEYLKKRHVSRTRSLSDDVVLPLYWTFVYSACGAVVAGVLSHPFDVTKTHRQIELGNAMLHNQKMSSSTWAYMKALRKNQGNASLFSGFYPRIIRVVVATATMITIFESMKTFFIQNNNRRRHGTFNDGVY